MPRPGPAPATVTNAKPDPGPLMPHAPGHHAPRVMTTLSLTQDHLPCGSWERAGPDPMAFLKVSVSSSPTLLFKLCPQAPPMTVWKTGRCPAGCPQAGFICYFLQLDQVHWFPGAALPKSCKLGDLKQQEFILSRCGRPHVQGQDVTGLCSPQRLPGRVLPPLPAPGGPRPPLACGCVPPVSASVISGFSCIL